ncbi:MAG: hypothetical protein AAF196_00775 [Planctomycetota bacterium]
MAELPTETELRATIADFDARQQNVLTAMIARLIEHSDKAKDKEWVSEEFARTVSLALELDDDPDLASATEGVDRVREWAQNQAPKILPVAFGVFGRVALTLQERGSEFGPADAMREVFGYLPGPPS